MASQPRVDDFWSPVGSAALAGLFLTVLDGVVAHRFADHAASQSTWCVLAITALTATIIGLISEFTPGRWRIIIPVVLCLTMGQSLALGPRAQAMFASSYWGSIGAIGIVIVALVGRKVGLHHPRLFKRLLLAVTVVSIGAFITGAMVQRGRYQAVRFSLNGLVFVGLWTSIFFVVRKRSRIFHVVAAIIATILGGFGTYFAINDSQATNWAITNSSAASSLVQFVRETALPELKVDSGREYIHQPILGTPLGQESLTIVTRELGENRGFLLVTIDAMRADLRNREVGGRPTVPHLDAMAATGADFRRAYSPAPMTHFSVFSFLSGWYPSQSLGFRGGFEKAPLITQALNKAGVETRGCYPKGMLIAGGDDFERFGLDFEFSSLHPWDDLSIDETFDRLRPRKAGPWFSYLHIMLPHDPYNQAAPEYQAGDSDFERYAAEVREADAYVKKLLQRFEAQGLAENMWVAVAADHGEEFAEHGSYKHSTQIFEESVHVPLVLKGKGIQAKRHDMPVSLVDLAPTLHHFFGLPTSDQTIFAGHSWLPLVCGFDDVTRPQTVIVENPPWHLAQFNTRAAIIGQDLKLIADERSRRLMLFDLKKDPSEKKDISSIEAEKRDHLWSELVARRRFGGQAKSIFETMKSFGQFLDEAAEQGPGGVFTYLSWMKGLAQNDELIALSYFLDHEDPLIPGKIREKYEETAVTDFVFLRDRIALGALPPSPEQWQESLSRFGTTAPSGINLSTYAIASKWHFRLPHADVFANSESLREQLSRAQYLSRVTNQRPPVELVNRGITSNSAWTQALALRAMVGLNLEGTSIDLRTYYETARLENLRILALRRLSEQKSIDMLDFFLDEARSKKGQLRSIAAFGLVQQSKPHPQIAIQDLGANAKDIPAGLTRQNEFFCALKDRRIALPVQTYASGTRLAVFLAFAFNGKRCIRLTLGSWSYVVNQTSVVPADPLVFEIPEGVTSNQLIMEVIEGEPTDFVIAGIMTYSSR
ncbi:MAG: arylsulfatase A-like enzyme [Planctomycetota bacterium]|jgi:arylsulfatase A-like enzyme